MTMTFNFTRPHLARSAAIAAALAASIALGEVNFARGQSETDKPQPPSGRYLPRLFGQGDSTAGRPDPFQAAERTQPLEALTGDAKATTGGQLPARWVVHAVGPVWRGGDAGEPELLASAHRRALEVAQELGARTVAFPAISCGIYGYPPELAAPVAVGAARELANAFEELRFVFRDEGLRSVFEQAAGS